MALKDIEKRVSAARKEVEARGETFYPGTDSERGCGGNSEYYVTWRVVRLDPA